MELFTGYSFLDFKQSLYSLLRDKYPSVGVQAAQIEIAIRSAVAAVDARLRYSVGKHESVTVEDQANYTMYAAPHEVVSVVCNDVVLLPLSWEQYLEAKQANSDSGDPAYYARWGNELYLLPTPDESGMAITAYMYQGAPLLEADADVPVFPAQYHHPTLVLAQAIALSDIPGQEQAAAFRLKQFETEFAALSGLSEPRRGWTRMQARITR